jgi:hypothetical protein
MVMAKAVRMLGLKEGVGLGEGRGVGIVKFLMIVQRGLQGRVYTREEEALEPLLVACTGMAVDIGLDTTPFPSCALFTHTLLGEG